MALAIMRSYFFRGLNFCRHGILLARSFHYQRNVWTGAHVCLALQARRVWTVKAPSRHRSRRWEMGLRFSLFLATRKVSECLEYRHVVPGYPPLCDFSAFDAENCPEIKLRLAT